MLNHLYQTYIKPHSTGSNAQNQELVLNWLLVSSLVVTLIAIIDITFSWIVFNDDYLEDRLLPLAAFMVFFAILLSWSRRTNRHWLPSLGLVILMFGAAFSVVFAWSIIDPIGIILFGLAIVMASILLGARFALYTALLSSFSLMILEVSKAHHGVQPNLAWQKQPSNLADVLSFSAVFAVLALTTWLFHGQIEQALKRAERSEKALKKQRDLLEVKVEQRTQALQAIQLEQVQQIYRFAELGHLSTALFHDLGNHIMSLSLDIEGLQKQRRSDLMKRIQANVNHIEDVVRRVQRQISGSQDEEHFNAVEEVQGIINILAYGCPKHIKVSLDSSTEAISFQGDLTRFRQLVMNLLANAIESYPPRGPTQTVSISLTKQKTNLLLVVTDHGKGMPANLQAKIFEPFYTTKTAGMGIGLFIVQKVISDLGGALRLSSQPDVGSSFEVILPLNHRRQQ